MPTESEWERLARGQNGREYPWGNSWQNGICNTDELGVKQPTPVGLFPTGESQAGAHDCAGNVWEWCADKVGNSRVLRGGSWSYSRYFARCANRFDYSPHYSSFSRGFRVVSPISGSES